MSTNIGYWERVIEKPTDAYKKLFESEKEYLVKNIQKNSSVLDVGCGDGRNMKTIFSVTENVTGVDNDKKAVNDAQRAFLKNPSVKVLLGDILSLPFKDGSFDYVVFFELLDNLSQNKIKALKETARVLKKEGKIFLGAYSEDALEERMRIYKQIGVPIDRVEGTKVIFDKSIGANESEQFSKKELLDLATAAGLKMSNVVKVDHIGYICTLKK